MQLNRLVIGVVSLILIRSAHLYAGVESPLSNHWQKTSEGDRNCYSYGDSVKGMSISINDASSSAPQLFSINGPDNSFFEIKLPHEFTAKPLQTLPALNSVLEQLNVSLDTIISKFNGGYYRWYWKSSVEFEWEIVLNSLPGCNSFNFPIDVSNMELFYQPPLTLYEIARGANRPDSVVGSYAAYSTSNSEDRKIYAKAFHIYRPKAFDSIGNSAWCDLKISNNILSIDVPAGFLNQAVFPVTIDPTVGYTSAGASSQSFKADGKMASRFILPETAIADSIFAYVRASSTPYPSASAAAYKGGSVNATFADSSGVRTISNTSASWQGFSLVSKSLVCQDTIWLTLQCSTKDLNLYLYYDNGTAGSDSSQTDIADPLPFDITMGTGAGGNRKYSIYMKYSSATCSGFRRRKLVIGDFNE